MSLLHDLRNLFKQDKQPPVTTVKAKSEIPAPVTPVIPNPLHQDIPDQAKSAPAGGTIVRQVVDDQQPSPPEILAQIDWAVKNAKTYRTGDLIENRYKVEEVMSGAMGYVYIGRDARRCASYSPCLRSHANELSVFASLQCCQYLSNWCSICVLICRLGRIYSSPSFLSRATTGRDLCRRRSTF